MSLAARKTLPAPALSASGTHTSENSSSPKYQPWSAMPVLITEGPRGHQSTCLSHTLAHELPDMARGFQRFLKRKAAQLLLSFQAVLLLWCVGFPGGEVVKNPPANAGDSRDAGSTPGSGKMPWSRKRQLTLVSLPGESHRQRSLAGYSPWGRKEPDSTERLSKQQRSEYCVLQSTYIFTDADHPHRQGTCCGSVSSVKTPGDPRSRCTHQPASTLHADWAYSCSFPPISWKVAQGRKAREAQCQGRATRSG